MTSSIEGESQQGPGGLLWVCPSSLCVWIPEVTAEFKRVFGLLSFYFIMCVCAQLHLTLWDPVDLHSLPGSSVHEISQWGILEGVAHSYTRGSSQPRNQTHNSCNSCIGRQFLYHYSIWEAPDACQIHHLISCFITHPWKHISYFLVWSSGSFELHPASSRGYEDQYFPTQYASTHSLGNCNLCVAGVAGLLWAHIFLAWDPLWRKIHFYVVPQTDPNSSLTNEKGINDKGFVDKDSEVTIQLIFHQLLLKLFFALPDNIYFISFVLFCLRSYQNVLHKPNSFLTHCMNIPPIRAEIPWILPICYSQSLHLVET